MPQPLTDAINALTTYANSVTGASDQTLSEAVATLASGYSGGSSHNLPSAYQEVTFLGVWNNCYFDIGTINYSKFGFRTKFLICHRNGGYAPHLISSYTEYFRFMPRTTGGTVVLYSGTENMSEDTVPVGYETYAEFNLLGDGAFSMEWADGTATLTATKGTVGSGQVYLFAYGKGLTNTIYQFNGLLYELALYDNGVLMKHFIPCYRKADNVIGLYDIIGNSFITTSGSGTLTRGKDK